MNVYQENPPQEEDRKTYPSNRPPRATNSLTPYSRVCEVPMQMREAHRAGLGGHGHAVLSLVPGAAAGLERGRGPGLGRRGVQGGLTEQ